ncbi:MAG TPA: hypothetical protein PKB13_06075 [Clostridia bacterium]|nr:hypothetical protein [Clostridia bacterium]
MDYKIDKIAPNDVISDSNCDSISKVDFLGKVIGVRADALPPEKRQARYQLYLAMCGQGTTPTPQNVSGTKFWGVDLYTGKEQNIFNRSDILGALKPEYLPQWAKDTLANLDVEVKRIINNAKAIAQRQSGHSR